jgi:hypothetical protein
MAVGNLNELSPGSETAITITCRAWRCPPAAAAFAIAIILKKEVPLSSPFDYDMFHQV